MAGKEKARLDNLIKTIEPGPQNIDELISQIEEEINPPKFQDVIEFHRNGKPGMRFMTAKLRIMRRKNDKPKQ